MALVWVNWSVNWLTVQIEGIRIKIKLVRPNYAAVESPDAVKQ